MSRTTVLIADDFEPIRAAVSATLNADPRFRVVGEAANGKEAVTKAIHLRPDIVLLDVSMPHMTGIEAALEIEKQLPHTLVAFLTGYDPALLGEYASEVRPVFDKISPLTETLEGLSKLVTRREEIERG